jgi:hypothetical protein
MILPTSLTSAQFFRYSPSSASPPLSHYTKTSGRVTPAGPVRQHGRSSMRALTCTGSKIAMQHGCRAYAVVDTRRTSVAYGHADIRNSQRRQWRGFLSSPSPQAVRWAVADVGPCWRCTGRASGLATRSLRNSACVMAFRYNGFCKMPFWICGRLSSAPSATLTASLGSRCVF